MFLAASAGHIPSMSKPMSGGGIFPGRGLRGVERSLPGARSVLADRAQVKTERGAQTLTLNMGHSGRKLLLLLNGSCFLKHTTVGRPGFGAGGGGVLRLF